MYRKSLDVATRAMNKELIAARGSSSASGHCTTTCGIPFRADGRLRLWTRFPRASSTTVGMHWRPHPANRAEFRTTLRDMVALRVHCDPVHSQSSPVLPRSGETAQAPRPFAVGASSFGTHLV